MPQRVPAPTWEVGIWLSSPTLQLMAAVDKSSQSSAHWRRRLARSWTRVASRRRRRPVPWTRVPGPIPGKEAQSWATSASHPIPLGGPSPIGRRAPAGGSQNRPTGTRCTAKPPLPHRPHPVRAHCPQHPPDATGFPTQAWSPSDELATGCRPAPVSRPACSSHALLASGC